jgi:hypothetical protein
MWIDEFFSTAIEFERTDETFHNPMSKMTFVLESETFKVAGCDMRTVCRESKATEKSVGGSVTRVGRAFQIVSGGDHWCDEAIRGGNAIHLEWLSAELVSSSLVSELQTLFRSFCHSNDASEIGNCGPAEATGGEVSATTGKRTNSCERRPLD